MKAMQVKVNSIIDLAIRLEELNRKEKLVTDYEINEKVKQIYGKPEYTERVRKAKAELDNLINDLLKQI